MHLKRLYEGIAGSLAVPFSSSGATAGMNNQEGRFPKGTGQGGSAYGAPALFPPAAVLSSLYSMPIELMMVALSSAQYLCSSSHLSCVGYVCPGDFPSGTGAVMLRTGPAALSRPGPFGAAGFHPRLSQRQHHACCIRKRMRRFSPCRR